MISISTASAMPGISPLATPATASSVSTASTPVTVGNQTPVSPSEVGLGSLTPDDWKLVSAAVGKNVGPDASGKIQPLQSLFAFTIADERAEGTLSSGQELTIGDLKGMGNGQTSQGFISQINNAISYLEQSLQTPLGASAGRMVNITA